MLPLNICLESPNDLKVIIAESTKFKAVTAAGGVGRPVHDVEDTIEPLLPSVVGFNMPGHQLASIPGPHRHRIYDRREEGLVKPQFCFAKSRAPRPCPRVP